MRLRRRVKRSVFYSVLVAGMLVLAGGAFLLWHGSSVLDEAETELLAAENERAFARDSVAAAKKAASDARVQEVKDAAAAAAAQGDLEREALDREIADMTVMASAGFTPVAPGIGIAPLDPNDYQ